MRGIIKETPYVVYLSPIRDPEIVKKQGPLALSVVDANLIFGVLPTHQPDLVLLLLDTEGEVNRAAMDMLSPHGECPIIRGRAVLVRDARGYVAGMSLARARYWADKLRRRKEGVV